MALTFGSVFKTAGKALGGVIKTTVRGAIGAVPGGGTALGIYDQYNQSRGRVGAFSPPGTVAPVAPVSGGGVIRGGGAPGLGGAPPGLPMISAGVPQPPGTSVATIPAGGTPQAGTGQTQVFQTPDGQWHAKTWRGARGHMTKGTSRNPSHWTNRRRPRMNPMNVHAARRSVRRLIAGEKLFRKIFRIMHHHKAAVAVKRGKK